MDDNGTNDNNQQQNVIDEQHRVLIEFLTNNDEMKKAAKNSLKQGLLAGGGAMVGGLLLGPIGGLIGGVTGSIIGFMRTENYEGAVQQILVLETTRKNHLIDAVKASLLDAGASGPRAFTSAENFRTTLNEYANNRAVRDQIWKACMEAIHE